MSGAVESWAALSFLECLRPGPDESVELAMLSSYSADLGSIGATLLALSGTDTDSGKGSPSDFADAVERLRGKTRIIIQRGRLAKMRRSPRIAAVLDQFVREVDFDEAIHSWHAKVALVRMRNTADETRWRLWIGSRNLTEHVNRDIGLLLVSSTKGGAPILGADELVRSLAERAELKGLRAGPLAATIGKVEWRAPAGVRVECIRWSAGTEDQPVPVPPPDTDEVIVVSPFIDKKFLAQLHRIGAKQSKRVLLTTSREIERIGPSLAAFDDLLTLDAPEFPVDDTELGSQSAEVPSDVILTEDAEEEVGGGLHAKLLFMRSGRKRTLWLGSANATLRAWTGRNAEATAKLVVTEPVERGLKSLLGSARLAEAPTDEYVPDADVLEEEALERARAQVAARLTAVISIDGEGIRLTHCSDQHPEGPHPDESDILLEVGALNGELLIWPTRQTEVHLGDVVPADRSEFVRLRVSRNEKDLSWLQRAPSEPPFGEDRDRAAFVRFLGARGFLLWVAGLLANDETESDGDWTIDDPQNPTGRRENMALDSSLPTLEEMLAAWTRDPIRFRETERRVSQYLPAMLEHAEQGDAQTAEMLKQFERLWKKLRSGLGTAKIKGRRR